MAARDIKITKPPGVTCYQCNATEDVLHVAIGKDAADICIVCFTLLTDNVMEWSMYRAVIQNLAQRRASTLAQQERKDLTKQLSDSLEPKK